jgi:hypothetical protein
MGVLVESQFPRVASSLKRALLISQHRCAAHAAAELSELQNRTSALSDLVPLLTDVANELRDRGTLDEEECFIDATFVMAIQRRLAESTRSSHS